MRGRDQGYETENLKRFQIFFLNDWLSPHQVITGFILTRATAPVIWIILSRLATHVKYSHAQDPPQKHLHLAPRRISDPLRFRKSVLERLVLGLSEQQLLAGLLLLPIAIYSYREPINQGNLNHAANLAYFFQYHSCSGPPRPTDLLSLVFLDLLEPRRLCVYF
jgi:hypothetical protein